MEILKYDLDMSDKYFDVQLVEIKNTFHLRTFARFAYMEGKTMYPEMTQRSITIKLINFNLN